MAQAQGVGVTNIYRTGLAGGGAIDDPQAFAARIAEYGLDGTNFLFATSASPSASATPPRCDAAS